MNSILAWLVGLVAGLLVPAPAPVPSLLVLGPEGVGSLRLGMSHAEVAATGADVVFGSRHDGWASGCGIVLYDERSWGRTPGDTLHGAVSPRQGLEQLNATRRMVTPEGIRIGSSLSEVRTAYDRPGLEAGVSLTIPASPETVYRLQLRRTVSAISLERRHQDCSR